MEYYVVAKDGSKFGPVSVDRLNEWAAEGRVVGETIIERASDGVRGAASKLPGIVMPPPVAAGSRVSTPAMPGTPTPPVPDAGVHSTAGRAGNVQFKEPDFVPAPRTPSPLYGEPPSSGYYGGYERDSYSYDAMPLELTGKFNWGAFFLTWIWGLCHKAYITLLFLALDITAAIINYASKPAEYQAGSGAYAGGSPIAGIIGLVLLGLKIWYGAKGYEWAWESGNYKTPEDCRRAQAIWGWCGLAFAVVFACFIFMVAMAIVSSRPGINPWTR